LSGGWGQTRKWIKQWEKDNGKKIDKATDWHDSGYICPYCAEKVAEFDIPHPISTASARAAAGRPLTLGVEQVPQDYLGRITANITTPTMFQNDHSASLRCSGGIYKLLVQTVYARNQAWNLNNIIDGCGNGSHHLG
jgi:hypothetical protein